MQEKLQRIIIALSYDKYHAKLKNIQLHKIANTTLITTEAQEAAPSAT